MNLNPLSHTLFRLDGHSFSKFVKKLNLEKPFDENFTIAMKNTAIECFNTFNFELGFVGSDEITYYIKALTQEQVDNNSNLEFLGRIQKMISLLAGKVSTVYFIQLAKLIGFDRLAEFTPHFDCRVWQVDTYEEVLEAISERVVYTLKNSRMMLGQSMYSQKNLNGLSSKQVVDKMLSEKNIDYHTVVPHDNRVGTIIYYKIEEHEKNINIKGVEKTIKYNRKVINTVNLGPTEIVNFLCNITVP